MAKAMGADAIIDPAAVDPVRQILDDTGQRGLDLAIDCATKPGTVMQCVDVVRRATRIVITGIPSEPETALNLHALRRKEVIIYNVRRSNHETEAAIEMLRSNPKLFAPMVTHRMPIEKAGRSFEMLETGEGGAAKIVLQFD
jgi:L-iditol 2-dehydrogenase